jgi:hypothetical protein
LGGVLVLSRHDDLFMETIRYFAKRYFAKWSTAFMGSNLFSNLATELQLQIFAELDPPALLALSQVGLCSVDLYGQGDHVLRNHARYAKSCTKYWQPNQFGKKLCALFVAQTGSSSRRTQWIP